MKRIHPIVPLGIAMPWLLAGCATTAAPPVERPAPDGRDVAIGQSAYVDGPVVRPVAVLEDSRCPARVQCVWAGRVRLKMLWVRPAGDRPFEAVLGEPVQLADGAFTLTAVRPEKLADKSIATADYRFSFRFEGGL